MISAVERAGRGTAATEARCGKYWRGPCRQGCGICGNREAGIYHRGHRDHRAHRERRQVKKAGAQMNPFNRNDWELALYADKTSCFCGRTREPSSAKHTELVLGTKTWLWDAHMQGVAVLLPRRNAAESAKPTPSLCDLCDLCGLCGEKERSDRKRCFHLAAQPRIESRTDAQGARDFHMSLSAKCVHPDHATSSNTKPMPNQHEGLT